MSSVLGEKLIIIRESERINRRQLSDLVGIPYGTLTYYETGRSTPPTDVAMKIFSHPQFLKYTLWFMTGKTAPEFGQIAPALAPYKQEEERFSSPNKK
ncbi:helix-turn-helix transcriptional regulator [Candidatus Regiella endosymbiont of Tuberolachnus salignus]|uniref:helix-turn-helix transcriptional regulator n=1 Tax=Candidatus Regiella endosymbiont of Tuberolachnus salignus TaxID=3077956 RepID=UPI0030CB7602